MSIEQRLRTGLAANTDVLLPQVDHELGVLLRRATRRRRARVAVAGLAAAAVVASAGYLTGVATDDQSKSPGPAKDHRLLYGATDMAGIDGPLEAGTYAVPLWGETDAADTMPRGVVDVPEGYFSPGGWVVDPGSGDIPSEADQYGALAFFYADRVVTDPCDGAPAQAIADTPEALATALTGLPDLRTSTPEPVTIGGHPGLHLKLRVAKGVDLNACIGDRLSLWMYGNEDAFFDIARTDIVTHLWILDVDGFRIIMSLELFPDQPPGQNAEMLAMAKNARFIDPLSSSE